MTEHQLSVVIKANADVTSLQPFQDSLNAIASKVDEVDGMLGKLAGKLSGNQALDNFLSAIKGTGSLDLNINVNHTGEGLGENGLDVKAHVTGLTYDKGLVVEDVTAKVKKLEAKDGLAIPNVTAKVIELKWAKRTHARIENVTAQIGEITFGSQTNNDLTKKQLNGVIGRIKSIDWEKSAEVKGLSRDNEGVPVMGKVISATIDESTIKVIQSAVASTKIEVVPKLVISSMDENKNPQRMETHIQNQINKASNLLNQLSDDFRKQISKAMKEALEDAADVHIDMTEEQLEKALSPLQKVMDDYLASKKKRVYARIMPEVKPKDYEEFVEKTNKMIEDYEKSYSLFIPSIPYFDYDSVLDIFDKMNDDLNKAGKKVAIPSMLKAAEIAYFRGGTRIDREQFIKENILEIPAVVRVMSPEEVDKFRGITGADENVSNDMKPKLADGKVITVGDGDADEMIVHRSLLERGPKYLDMAFAHLVSKSKGGTDVYVPDFNNTAVIPADRYLEFKSKIYGGKFAYGKGDVEVGGYDEYVSALRALAMSMPSAIEKIDRLGEYSPKSEIDATINAVTSILSPALERVNANTDELEDLVRRYGGDMAAMPQAVREAVLQATSNRGYYSTVMTLVQQRLAQADKTDGELNEFLKKLGDTSGETNKKLERIEKALGTIVSVESSSESKGPSGGGLEMSRWQQIKSWAASDEGQSRIKDAAFKIEGRALSAGANISETLLKKTLGLVQDIYNKMKEASPLLQTVSTLFNLAMRLFFMPLGNKLAEVLIPKTVELVEKITDMWDMFDEETSLGDMFNKAIDYGFEVFGEYFMGIGDRLQEQGGIISSVGGMLSSIGKFIESNGKSLIQFLIGMMSTIIDHFREVIATIVAFKVASVTLGLAQLAATMTPDPFGLGLGKTLALPIIMGLLAGGIATGALYMAIPGKADGGFVPATPGGRPTLLAEGGEGEFVIPASKMAQVIAGGLDPLMQVVGGSSVRDAYPSTGGLHLNSLTPSGVQAVGGIGSVVNANYYISGYTDSELEGIIQRTVNDMTYDSRLKGRYW